MDPVNALDILLSWTRDAERRLASRRAPEGDEPCSDTELERRITERRAGRGDSREATEAWVSSRFTSSLDTATL